MDLIAKSLAELRFRIPNEILKMAYQENVFGMAPISLDEQIRRKTIQARVIVDTNIAGGETILVDLNGLQPQMVDRYNYIFDIPGERVNYRTILTALSVNYMAYNSVMNNYMPGTSSSTPNYINDVSSAAHRAMDSRSNIPIVSNAECTVVGHNTIMIRNHLVTAAVVQLRCVVCNDERLNNISIRNAPEFSKLCELAVKSYIYNTLLVKLDKGYLERGQELGVIKSYVDGLADAEENYQTYLRETWGAVGIMNDRLTYENLLHIQMDPGL